MLRFILIVTASCFARDLFAQPERPMDAARLRQAIKKLRVVGSVLYVGAHPDDENTAVLATTSNGLPARTGYLSLTRGDGGQNLIGTEQGEALGLIRTQELLAARRIDGAEQFFTRAVDFGYSKSPGETFKHWNREILLSDVVRVIRQFQPDVIVTRFPETGEGGHGHHTASAILAVEAFRAAADPNRFPEHKLKPWQAKRIVWNAWPSALSEISPRAVSTLDVGEYSPLLGLSYTEIAAFSRSMHKSQGFGASGRRGETLQYFVHLAGDTAQGSPFSGLNRTWADLGVGVDSTLDRIEKSFNPEQPELSIVPLLGVYRQLSRYTDLTWAKQKQSEILTIVQSCAGLWLEAVADRYVVTPGDSLAITLGMVTRLKADVQLRSVRWPDGQISTLDKALEQGQFVELPYRIGIDRLTGYSTPYWLREPAANGLFQIQDPEDIGQAENRAPLLAECTFQISGDRVVIAIPVLYRWTDRVRGELYRRVEVVPPVSVVPHEREMLFVNGEKRELKVTLRGYRPNVSGVLDVEAPAGWAISPRRASFQISDSAGEQMVAFTVSPSAQPSSGEFVITIRGQEVREVKTIAYDHIALQTYLASSRVRVVRLQSAKVVQRIGYLMGSGDDIPDVLRQLGYDVVFLSDDDVEQMDLSRFDAIVGGIRVYNTRPRMRLLHQKLMDYVKGGGNYVVQYNVTAGLDQEIGPYPIKLSHDRISEEDVPLKVLEPGHAIMTFPNKLDTADFTGWVQERGLYFASEWDARYTPLFAGHDDGEEDRRGGTLVATYGRGTYVYTGLSFFRQFPAAVPGAIRLWVNMISLSKAASNR